MTITPLSGTESPYIHLFTDGAPPPVSERLVRALEAQIAAEADDATRASAMADTSGDRAINVVLELIVEDAQRHEDLLHRMVKRLRQELEFAEALDGLPVPGTKTCADADEFLTTLRGLIRNRQEGARYLRHLARQDADLYDGYLSLLLDTFARDGEKHVHLLRYLLRQVEVQ